jgi:hypothetical protein
VSTLVPLSTVQIVTILRQLCFCTEKNVQLPLPSVKKGYLTKFIVLTVIVGFNPPTPPPSTTAALGPKGGSVRT